KQGAGPVATLPGPDPWPLAKPQAAFPRDLPMRPRYALFAAFALCTPSSACAAEPLKKGERIVFLGDSITQAGVGQKGYVTLIKNVLAEKHKDLEIEVLGAGISGNKVP